MTSLMEAAEAMGMTFAKFFPSDWRTGCMNLDLEEEGLYIRVCAYHYDLGKALPDDYPYCAHVLRVNLNKFTKVMNSLISKGKIIRAQGLLFNERVVEEFDRYRQEHAARVAAAKKREEVRREKLRRVADELEERRRLDATPQLAPNLAPELTPLTERGVPTPNTGNSPTQWNGKNNSNINGNDTTVVAEAWHGSTTNPEARSQKPEIKRTPPLLEQASTAASGGEFLDDLNGTATDLIAFIAKHAFVEPRDAQRMLTTNVKTFGTDAMMEAYSVTLANMGGQFISAPYKYLIETARRIKTSGKTSQPARVTAASEMAAKRERIRKHAEEAAEAYERQRGRP